jgi:hypothetical protein
MGREGWRPSEREIVLEGRGFVAMKRLLNQIVEEGASTIDRLIAQRQQENVGVQGKQTRTMAS